MPTEDISFRDDDERREWNAHRQQKSEIQELLEELWSDPTADPAELEALTRALTECDAWLTSFRKIDPT